MMAQGTVDSDCLVKHGDCAAIVLRLSALGNCEVTALPRRHGEYLVPHWSATCVTGSRVAQQWTHSHCCHFRVISTSLHCMRALWPLAERAVVGAFLRFIC